MKLFSVTDIGKKRELNEDYIYTSEKPIGVLPNLFIVADGMGGHNAGDYASKHTVEKVVEIIGSETDIWNPDDCDEESYIKYIECFCEIDKVIEENSEEYIEFKKITGNDFDDEY